MKMVINIEQNQEKALPRSSEAGFSLLELIVVMFIIVILLLGVFLVMDPVQMLGRAWDSQRQTDVAAIVDAIEFTSASGQTKERGGVDLDGANTDTCSGEASATVYVSVPDGNGSGGCTAPPNDLPAGWTYGCANSGSESNIDGTGWVPIDLTQGGSITSPISHLSSDPADSWASGHFYTYVCGRSGTYEITARMTSNKFRTGGESDIQSTDGGDDIFVYETGTDLNLDPKAPVGYWGLNGGTSGTIADGETVGFEDASGNDNNGAADNNGTAMAWVPGVLGGAVDFDGTDDFVRIPDSTSLSPTADITVVAWVNQDALTVNKAIVAKWDYGIPDGDWLFQNYSFGGGDQLTAVILPTAGEVDGDEYGYSAAGSFTTGWEHVLFVFDGSGAANPDRLKIFIDGTEEALTFVGTIPSALPDSGADVTIGQFEFLGRFWNGLIDEVAIYDRSLDVAEISYQYETLKP